MTTKSTVAAAALYIEKIIQLAAVAAVSVVVLRSLGPHEAGYLSAATAILAMALPLTGASIVPIVGILSKTNDSSINQRLVGQSFLYSLSAAGLCAGALVVLALVMGEPVGKLLLILSVGLLARPLWAVEAWFQATHRNSIAAGMRTVGVIITAGARIYIALTSASLELLAWAVVAEHVLVGLAMTVFYIARNGRLRFGGLPSATRKAVWSTSWPLMISGIAVILYMRVDQPMILWLSNSAQVSFYAAAANLSDALSFIPSVAFTILFPYLIREFEIGRERFLIVNQIVISCGALASFVIVPIGLLMAPHIVVFLFGSEYSASGVLLQILLLGVPFIFMSVLQVGAVVVFGVQKLNLVITCLALTVSVVLNLFIIPMYGAFGAAITTVLAYAVGGVVGNVLFAETRPIFRQQMRAFNIVYSFLIVFRFFKNRKSSDFESTVPPVQKSNII